MSDHLVTVNVDDLRTVLRQCVMHSHRIPGIWDADNRDLAGMPCVECASRARLTAATRFAVTVTDPDAPRDGLRSPETAEPPTAGVTGRPDPAETAVAALAREHDRLMNERARWDADQVADRLGISRQFRPEAR